MKKKANEEKTKMTIVNDFEFHLEEDDEDDIEYCE